MCLLAALLSTSTAAAAVQSEATVVTQTRQLQRLTNGNERAETQRQQEVSPCEGD